MTDRLAPMELRLMAAVSGSLEGVNVTRLCRELATSTKTFYKWRARYLAEGIAGLEPRSRRPLRSPSRTPDVVEDRIVELRKALADTGLDGGPATIVWHLAQGPVPVVVSEATVWRVLVRRGFIVPAPNKRPRRCWHRFEAVHANEMWQIDGTDWCLADGTAVKVIDVLDDHSRYLTACHAASGETGAAAWAAFSAGVEAVGMPSRLLSDNGLAFSGRLRGFEVEFEKRLRAVGVRAITSAPFHPQTCGKVERFHQTLKKWLGEQSPVATLTELQARLDWFRHYYNHERPHRAIGRIPPAQRFAASPRTAASTEPIPEPDQHVTVTVRTDGRAEARQWIIGLGVEYAGHPADVYLSASHANVFIAGQLVRHVVLDHTQAYQPSGRKRGGPRRPRPE